MSALSFLPKHLRLVLFICLVYILAWLGYYGQITLGQYPSKEETYALQTALSGTADVSITLYGKLLASFGAFAGSESGLLSTARIINGLALLLAAFVCGTTAGHFWKSTRAAFIAALFVGLNPVILFRIGEVTPTVLATLCVAVFFWRITRWLRRARTIDSFIISSALAIGTLFETSLVGLALLWPITAFLYPTRHKALHLILGTIPTVIAFGLVLISDLQLQQALSLNTSTIVAKLYGFFSNQELSDGISYTIQSKQHLLLLLNPIHWGLLIILAAGGLYARIKDGYKGYSVYTCLIALFIFWITNSFTSGDGQNRLALVPLLAIFSAGSFTTIPRIWKHAGKLTRSKIIISIVFLVGITYTGYFMNGPSNEVKERDYTFMAEASIHLGKTETAVAWAEKALEINHSRDDMRNVIVRAQFNEWATVSKPKPLSIEQVNNLLKAIDAADPSDPTIASIQGIYLWKLKDRDRAITLWKANTTNSALAQIGMLWSQDQQDVKAPNKLAENIPYYDLLHIANQIDRSALIYSEEERMIDNLFAEAH